MHLMNLTWKVKISEDYNCEMKGVFISVGPLFMIGFFKLEGYF